MARDALRAAQWSLALRFALLVALLLGGGGAGVFLYVRHALLAAFDASFDLAFRSILETTEQTGGSLAIRHEKFQEEFTELSVTLGVVSVALWRAGQPLAQASVHHESFSPYGPGREVRGEREHAIAIRREPVGTSGVVMVVGRRAGEIEERLAPLREILLFIGPAGLLGALALGWVMARQALKPVQLAMDQQRAFMADASHELRTPLAIIRAQAEVQLDAGDDAPERRAALEQILRTTIQLGRFVDDLLFLARTDAASLTPKRLVVALDELAEEALEALDPMARAQGSRLSFLAPPTSVEVEVDPAQIQRLLLILVDNALRHAHPGLIEVRVERAGPQVRLRVDDEGPGIAPELRPRLFERFTRGTSHREGHGLGLAIARSITLAHRGTIALEPSALGGTSVVVTLPARGG